MLNGHVFINTSLILLLLLRTITVTDSPGNKRAKDRHTVALHKASYALTIGHYRPQISMPMKT